MERDHLHNISLISSSSLDLNPQPEHSQHLNVTTVLNYCKTKILKPYLRLLSIIGLRPLINDQQETGICIQFLNGFYIIQVILFLIIGYFLQYMACFRRDRGFCYKIIDNFLLKSEINAIYERICNGPVIFNYIIPSALHLTGYLYAVIIIRHSDDDQLPVLMERVFLTSTTLPSCVINQRKLIKTLWYFVIFSTIWMILSIGIVNCMMANGQINFKWLETNTITLKVLLIICTLWQDIVQATIVSNYCLQAQLLTAYLQFLRENILQRPIQALEWMRDIEDLKKMLNYINNEIAPSVCILTTMNIVCAISGLIWLFHYDNIDKQTTQIKGISLINVILWLLIALGPFVQAARLSTACEVLRNVGQEVRVRPFVHQVTPSGELDTILLYTISLNLSAKLFFVPITTRYLCLSFVFIIVVILVLGQCHYLS